MTFLQSGRPLRRNDPNENPEDFRWLIDLEDPDFYGFQLPMRDRVFRQRLFVKQGMFYTLLRSCATFDVVGGPNEQSGIYLARYIGANLDLGANECVSLKVNGTSVLPSNAGCGGQGKSYQFFFVNNCIRSDRCSGSDFYLNFDAVAIPINQRFELVLNTACAQPPPDPFEQIFDQLLKRDKSGLAPIILNTDPSPCMGTGFGSGGAMPTFPPG